MRRLLLLLFLPLSLGNIAYDPGEYMLCFFGRYDISQGEIVVGVIPRYGGFSCVVSFYIRKENTEVEEPNLWATVGKKNSGCYLVDKGGGKQRYIRCSCNKDSAGPCNSLNWFLDQLLKLVPTEPKDAILLQKALTTTRMAIARHGEVARVHRFDNNSFSQVSSNSTLYICCLLALFIFL